jgi:multimeric flavodoxin WrbA
MKVIGINANPRGKESNTLKLVTTVLEGAKPCLGSRISDGILFSKTQP